MGKESVQTAARERLKPLVGRWTMKMTGAPPWPSDGHMELEWFRADVPLLIQRIHIDIPEAPEAVAFIGCDGMSNTYQYLYTDERDVQRILTMTLEGGLWMLLREGEPFSQRFTGRFSDDGMTITGRWEMKKPGEDWKTDIEVLYTKVP